MTTSTRTRKSPAKATAAPVESVSLGELVTAGGGDIVEVPSTEVKVDDLGIVAPDSTEASTPPAAVKAAPKAPAAKKGPLFPRGIPTSKTCTAWGGCTVHKVYENDANGDPHCRKAPGQCKNAVDSCPDHIRPAVAKRMAAKAAAVAKSEAAAKIAAEKTHAEIVAVEAKKAAALAAKTEAAAPAAK